MSKTGEVVYQIVGDNSKFKSDIKDTETLAASGYSGIKSKGTVAFAAIGAAVVAAGTATAKLLGDVINLGKEFETKFAQVETIMDSTQMSTEDMEKAIRGAAVDLGVDAGDLSEAVYNAISATGDTAGAVDLVTQATKLAKAGFTDSSSALSVLTTAMNAYGLSAEEAESLSDSLITTQNLGVLTMGELSGAMGKAIATGSAYGVNVHNLEAGYIALTKSGINVNESTTYLSGMMKELGTESSKSAKILKEKTGQSFGQLMKSGASLADVLDILLESVDGDTEAMMNLWGSAEAGKAANAIISQGLVTFNDNLKAVSTSAGVTQAAYKTMSETAAQKSAILQSSIKELGLSIYEDLDGPVADVTESLTGYVQDLTDAYSTEGLSGMVEAMGGILSSILTKIVAEIPNVISAGIDFLLALAKGFARDLPTVVPKMIKGLVDAMVSLVSNAKNILEIGVQIVAGIVKGILSAIPALVKGLGDALKGLVKGTDKYAAGLTDTLSDIEDAYEGAVDRMGEASDTLNESLGTIGAKSSEAQKMIDRLKELESQTSLTNDEQAEWNGLLAKLSETIPGITSLIDLENGTIQGGTEALQLYKDAWYESARAQAYAQAASQYLAEEIELERQLTEAKQAQGEAQAVLNGYYQQQQAIIDMVNKTLGTHCETVEDAIDVLDAAEGTVDDVDGKFTDWKDTLVDSQTAIEEYTPVLEDATASVEEIEAAHDEAAEKIDYFLDKSAEAEEAAKNYGETVGDTAESVEADFTKISGTSVTMSTTAQGAFLAMVREATSQGKELDDKTKAMAENILANYSDLPDDLQDAGKNALIGLIEGMGLKLADLGLTADASADQIVTAIKRVLQIGSPSKVMDDFGQNVGLGLINGMTAKQSAVKLVGQNTADKVKEGIASRQSQISAAGQSLGTGLIGGLNSGTSWVMGRIGGWCSNIINKIKGSLGIHSPSTIIKEQVGENMALAIPVAFEEEEYDAEKRIGKSVKAMIDGPLAGITLPDINLLGGMATAGTAAPPIVLQLQLDGEVNVDGLTLGNILLRNLDDAAAFVLPA